jgi:hypothetical protein
MQTESYKDLTYSNLTLSAFLLFDSHTLKSQSGVPAYKCVMFLNPVRKLQEITFLKGGLNNNVLVLHTFLCSK